jgi:diguanylate cyclase (GGDEF)-like protein
VATAPVADLVMHRRFSAAVCRDLRNCAAEVAASPDLASAAAALSTRVTRLLGVTAVVEPTRVPRGVPVAALAGAVPAAVAYRADEEARESTWSLGTHGGASWVLRLPGRWTQPRARACLDEFARLLAGTLQAPAQRQQSTRTEDIVAAAYTFSRRLTRLHSGQSLRQFIVDTMATVTRARLGALALHDEDAGQLHIPATHGYPQILVEHVRTAPGEGVLGMVFESKKPLLVRDLRELPAVHSRRPRYRTPSFLAVPLLANGDALGVISLADRTDGRPFSRSDLTAARALAAPAALALLNDRLSRQTRELAHAATIDPLTGLFNRRYFHTRIEEEIERSRRYGLDLALLLADVDDFKQLNDQLGHLAGDYLLRQIAEVLKRSVRVFDVCTRFGGEEFAILMPGSGSSNAMVVAERIRSRVESASREEGRLPPRLRITVSLGLAVLASDSSSQELIARADRALYRAKADGKNRVSIEG